MQSSLGADFGVAVRRAAEGRGGLVLATAAAPVTHEHAPQPLPRWDRLGVRDDFAHFHILQRYRVHALNHPASTLGNLIRVIL